MAKIAYRAACWDCNDFYIIGKTKSRLHDRKGEHFKALINGRHTSALADHVMKIKETLKIKEKLMIKDLKSAAKSCVFINFYFSFYLSPLT